MLLLVDGAGRSIDSGGCGGEDTENEGDWGRYSSSVNKVRDKEIWMAGWLLAIITGTVKATTTITTVIC